MYSVDRLVSFQYLISFRRGSAVGKFRILRSEVLVRDFLSRVGIEQRAVGERFGFDSEDSALGVAEKLHRNGVVATTCRASDSERPLPVSEAARRRKVSGVEDSESCKSNVSPSVSVTISVSSFIML